MPDAAIATSTFRPTLAVAHPWIRWLMRLGFLARGVLYLAVGVLTMLSVAHDHRRARGGLSETFITISSFNVYYLRPGTVLLAGLAIGFAGFAVGMMWTAIFDWNQDGTTTAGWSRRIGTFIGGVGHIGLAATAILMILGHRPDDGDTRRWSIWALQYPGGRIGVAIAGGWAMGYGFFLLSKTLTGRLDNKLDYSQMSKSVVRWTNITGRLGMLSRGAIYLTIGLILLIAAYVGTARDVVGFGGAMHTIARDTFGWLALCPVALGLAAYGIFMFIEARYRLIGRMRAEEFA